MDTRMLERGRRAAWAAALLLGLLLASAPASALGDGSRGTSGAAFLKIGPGARPAAMGEAYSAVADDIHAVYYNPAGLARVGAWELTGMHDRYFQGLDYNFIAFAVPVSRLVSRSTGVWSEYAGTVAVGVYDLAVDGMERRGETDTNEPTGTFESDDMAIALAYGRRIDEKLSLGGAGKIIRQSLDDRHGTAFAADLGALYQLDKRLTLAAGVRHLGTGAKLGGESDPLPLTGYLGAAYRLREPLTFSLDLGVPRDRVPTVSVGTEYTRKFSDDLRAALRAGYFTRNTDADGFNGVSLGFGLGFGRAGFDFAWVPFGDLGNTFRYSLLLKF